MDVMDVFAELTSPPNSSPSTYGCEPDIYYFDSPSSPSIGISPETSSDLPFSREYPNPVQTEAVAEIIKPEPPVPAAKPKHKRENRYKNAPPSVLSRRRAQNRASQRAYRERKDQRIKDLEVILNETQKKNESLTQAYAALQAEYLALKSQQTAPVWQTGIPWDGAVATPPFSDVMLYFGGQTANFGM
ncbi:hypothetical protein F4861DRAFT_415715 [Xylaria intraflava]|nr:hypothetical protein F4861DRAFT_415715 [Xylaria intraflava]